MSRQLSFTRTRCYATHRFGKKYDGRLPKERKGRSDAHGRPQLARDEDAVKAESARIFYAMYVRAREDQIYVKLRKSWQQKYG